MSSVTSRGRWIPNRSPRSSRRRHCQWSSSTYRADLGVDPGGEVADALLVDRVAALDGGVRQPGLAGGGRLQVPAGDREVLVPLLEADRVVDADVVEEDARGAGGVEVHDVGQPEQQPGERQVDPLAPADEDEEVVRPSVRAGQLIPQPADAAAVADADQHQPLLVVGPPVGEEGRVIRHARNLHGLQPAVDAGGGGIRVGVGHADVLGEDVRLDVLRPLPVGGLVRLTQPLDLPDLLAVAVAESEEALTLRGLALGVGDGPVLIVPQRHAEVVGVRGQDAQGAFEGREPVHHLVGRQRVHQAEHVENMVLIVQGVLGQESDDLPQDIARVVGYLADISPQRLQGRPVAVEPRIGAESDQPFPEP